MSTDGTRSRPALVSSAEDFLANDFDFVIVGGGTAGLAVAARLSENPDVKVGVLEAGKSRLDDPLVDTPAMFLKLLGNPEYDYGFRSEPQVCFTPASLLAFLAGKIVSLTVVCRRETGAKFTTCLEASYSAARVASTI